MAFGAKVQAEPWSQEEKTETYDVVVVGSGIAAEAFAENDFSEAKLSEFQKRLGEMYNPIWAQYAAIRKMIVGNREVARDLILTARAKPEYPDIYYGACFSEYMAKVFHSDAKMSFGNQLADRD